MGVGTGLGLLPLAAEDGPTKEGAACCNDPRRVFLQSAVRSTLTFSWCIFLTGRQTDRRGPVLFSHVARANCETPWPLFRPSELQDLDASFCIAAHHCPAWQACGRTHLSLPEQSSSGRIACPQPRENCGSCCTTIDGEILLERGGLRRHDGGRARRLFMHRIWAASTLRGEGSLPTAELRHTDNTQAGGCTGSLWGFPLLPQLLYWFEDHYCILPEAVCVGSTPPTA